MINFNPIFLVFHLSFHSTWTVWLIVQLLKLSINACTSGHDLKEVIARLRGEILENWQTTGTLAALFALGGFLLKVIACSGDQDGPTVRKLGIGWDTETEISV